MTPASRALARPIALAGLVALVTSGPRATAAEPEQRPGLVVAGGVSLGAYQAGMVHLFNEHYLHRGLVGHPIAVGTSAGAVNASVAAFAACAEPQPRPERSVFFRVWVPFGIDGEPSLYSPGAVTARSILDPKANEAAAQRFVDWLREPHAWRRCETILGVTATRLTPRFVPVTQPDGEVGITRVSQHGEKFVVEVRTGPDRPPTIMPHPPPQLVADLHPHLGPGEASEPVAIDDLIDAVVASGAFPVAFPPRTVVERLRRLDGTLGPPRSTRFVDGGVYANIPLEPAAQIGEWDGQGSHDYLLVHPELTPPFLHERPPPTPTSSLGTMLMRFFGDVVDTSLQKGLIEALLWVPELRAPEGARLTVPPRRTVTAGEHMFAFLGFFEAAFREFDFYLGMLDGLAVIRARGEEPPPWDSPTFDCFVAWDEASGGFEHTVKSTPPACTSAPPRLVALLRASLAYKAWLIEQDPLPESEVRTDRWFAALDEAGFQPSGGALRSRVRALLGDAVTQLADAQSSFMDGAMVRVGGPIALNDFIYQEPLAMVALGAHVERGFSVAAGIRPGPSWLRLDLALRASAIGARFEHPRRPPRTGWVPSAHLHLAWLPSTSPWFQVEPYAGAAMALPVGGFLGRPVAARMGIDAGIHWVAAQRVYLTTGASGFLYDRYFDGFDASASRATASPIQVNLGLGLRLLP